jgi:hypothetical protein
LLKHFDVDFYKNFEHHEGKSDLAHMTNEEALIHFLRRGKLEGRAYNKWLYSFIDPAFYVTRYPEVKLESVQDVVRHWMYIGAFQKLVPNQVTQDLIDADIHLFNMGKVGSKSIEAALVHALEPSGACCDRRCRRSSRAAARSIGRQPRRQLRRRRPHKQMRAVLVSAPKPEP